MKISKDWQEHLSRIGKIGGGRKSEAKTVSSRLNGMKPKRKKIETKVEAK